MSYLKTLSEEEIIEINGGNWFGAISAAIFIYDSIQDSFEGFEQGFRRTYKG